MESYRVIGVMSGTSLDGIDIACCNFRKSENWEFEIETATTIPYSDVWKKKLTSWYRQDRYALKEPDQEYGAFLAQIILDFITKNNIQPDLIASHGHTILHQPHKGITLQIGDGRLIAEKTGIPVIFDFRSEDVAKGGQGAPLVPIGDRLLFYDYDFCINLGGFANISFEYVHQRMAYDICPANIVLNEMSQRLGYPFDKDGMIARSGNVNQTLFNKLNELEYYQAPYPKSLGREWVENYINPIIDASKIEIKDVISTFTRHIAHQILLAVKQKEQAKVLITGGGAYNLHLIELIKKQARQSIVIPDAKLVNFKEALVFAFLGVLRWRNEINCLCSVTGASSDTSAGVIARP
ncbi:MAG: anhydro-N-acetylmuramic acid kinase [Bacteroidales bacterium]